MSRRNLPNAAQHENIKLVLVHTLTTELAQAIQHLIPELPPSEVNAILEKLQWLVAIISDIIASRFLPQPSELNTSERVSTLQQIVSTLNQFSLYQSVYSMLIANAIKNFCFTNCPSLLGINLNAFFFYVALAAAALTTPFPYVRNHLIKLSAIPQKVMKMSHSITQRLPIFQLPQSRFGVLNNSFNTLYFLSLYNNSYNVNNLLLNTFRSSSPIIQSFVSTLMTVLSIYVTGRTTLELSNSNELRSISNKIYDAFQRSDKKFYVSLVSYTLLKFGYYSGILSTIFVTGSMLTCLLKTHISHFNLPSVATVTAQLSNGFSRSPIALSKNAQTYFLTTLNHYTILGTLYFASDFFDLPQKIISIAFRTFLFLSLSNVPSSAFTRGAIETTLQIIKKQIIPTALDTSLTLILDLFLNLIGLKLIFEFLPHSKKIKLQETLLLSKISPYLKYAINKSYNLIHSCYRFSNYYYQFYKIYPLTYFSNENNYYLGNLYKKNYQFEKAIRAYSNALKNEKIAQDANNEISLCQLAIAMDNVHTQKNLLYTKELLAFSEKPIHDRSLNPRRHIEWYATQAQINIITLQNESIEGINYLLGFFFETTVYDSNKNPFRNGVWDKESQQYIPITERFPLSRVKSDSLKYVILPAIKNIINWFNKKTNEINDQSHEKDIPAAKQFLIENIDIYKKYFDEFLISLNTLLHSIKSIEINEQTEEFVRLLSEGYKTLQKGLDIFIFNLADCYFQEKSNTTLAINKFSSQTEEESLLVVEKENIVDLTKDILYILTPLLYRDSKIYPDVLSLLDETLTVSRKNEWRETQKQAINYKKEQRYDLAFIHYALTCYAIFQTKEVLKSNPQPNDLNTNNTEYYKAYYRGQYNCGMLLVSKIAPMIEDPIEKLRILMEAMEYYQIALQAGCIMATDNSESELAHTLLSDLVTKKIKLLDTRMKKIQEKSLSRDKKINGIVIDSLNLALKEINLPESISLEKTKEVASNEKIEKETSLHEKNKNTESIFKCMTTKSLEKSISPTVVIPAWLKAYKQAEIDRLKNPTSALEYYTLTQKLILEALPGELKTELKKLSTDEQAIYNAYYRSCYHCALLILEKIIPTIDNNLQKLTLLLESKKYFSLSAKAGLITFNDNPESPLNTKSLASLVKIQKKTLNAKINKIAHWKQTAYENAQTLKNEKKYQSALDWYQFIIDTVLSQEEIEINPATLTDNKEEFHKMYYRSSYQMAALLADKIAPQGENLAKKIQLLIEAKKYYEIAQQAGYISVNDGALAKTKLTTLAKTQLTPLNKKIDALNIQTISDSIRRFVNEHQDARDRFDREERQAKYDIYRSITVNHIKRDGTTFIYRTYASYGELSAYLEFFEKQLSILNKMENNEPITRNEFKIVSATNIKGYAESSSILHYSNVQLTETSSARNSLTA